MSQKSNVSRRGFTLIELLMVIAVIGILAAITFGISGGVRNAQNRAKVKVELAAITQALEAYKARYGDYPWHDSDAGEYPTAQVDLNGTEIEVDVTSAMLMYALTGRLKFDPQQAPDPVFKVDDSMDDPEVERSPKFLDISKFSFSVDDNGNPGALLDPWGNPYIYWYKWEDTSGAWDVFGYHLYSTGAANAEEAAAANTELKGEINPSSGVLSDEFRETADAAGIIFSGE